MQSQKASIKIDTNKQVLDKIDQATPQSLCFIQLLRPSPQSANHLALYFLSCCKEFVDRKPIIFDQNSLEEVITKNKDSRRIQIVCKQDLLSHLIKGGTIKENDYLEQNQAILNHPTVTVSLPALISKTDQLQLRVVGYQLNTGNSSDPKRKNNFHVDQGALLFKAIKEDLSAAIRLYSENDLKKAKQFLSPPNFHIELTVAVQSIGKPGSQTTPIEPTSKYIHAQFNLTSEQQFIKDLQQHAQQLTSNHQPAEEGVVSINPAKFYSPHLFVRGAPKPKYQQYYCRGIYQYFHYGDQSFNDQGWGCAYRALQSILSWFRCQGRISVPVPTIPDIQRTIDRINVGGDKLAGTNEWIGATEVSWVVTKLTGCNCRILHVSDGAGVLENCEMFRDHLERTGCPIMYGGDQYAYSIIGMNYSVKLYECEFLIMDPHYQGPDSLDSMVARKGISWRTPKDMFKKGIFYNFCLPIVPNDYS